MVKSISQIICFGDSITAAEEVEGEARWTQILQSSLSEHHSSVVVCNVGRGGATTGSAFNDFEQGVIPRLPGLVLLQFGFNDSNVRAWTDAPRVSVSEYERNLFIFTQAIYKLNGLPIFIRNHLPLRAQHIHGNGYSFNKNFDAYDQSLQALAHTKHIPMIDINAHLTAMALSSHDIVNEDGLHLTKRGNQIYAQIIKEGILELLPTLHVELSR